VTAHDNGAYVTLLTAACHPDRYNATDDYITAAIFFGGLFLIIGLIVWKAP
jgi:hypothetical protein